jgi:hypothetical protein
MTVSLIALAVLAGGAVMLVLVVVIVVLLVTRDRSPRDEED